MRRITLIDDARTVARKAWSVRLAVLSAVFSGLEALSGLLPLLPLPPRTMALLAVACALGAAFSRLVSQPKMRGGQRG